MSALLRAVLSMSAATGLSRLTGFLRTMVQAATLGTGAVAGAYTLANALPTQIFELFMGGVLASIFVPLLVERRTRHGEEDAREFAAALLVLVIPLSAIVAALGILFARPLILLTTDWTASLSPAEATVRTDLAVLLFRFFALQVLFYGVGAVATGVLNTHRRFFRPTFAPVLNNLAVILSLVAYALLVPRNPDAALYTLAIGTTLGVALMSLVLVPPALRLGYGLRFRQSLRHGRRHPALWRAARLSVPVLVLVAATVGVQVVSNLVASRYDGVDELYYAFVVFLLPYGVLVVSIVTALVPELSEKHARRDEEGYREVLSAGLRATAFVTVPALAVLAALATPAVGLLYERGEFGPADTAAVAAVLVAYAVGLPGFAVQFLLVRAFYARQNTRTPALLNLGLLAGFATAAPALAGAFGLPGVALAYAAAHTLLAAALLLTMRRELGRLDGRRLANSLIKILAAGTVTYLVARTGLYLTGVGSSLVNRAAITTLIGSLSLAAYFGTALLLRTEEPNSAIRLLKRTGSQQKRS